MDKSRWQFEDYILNKPNAHIDPLKMSRFGYYYYHLTREAWEAWQASRESLEVELPKAYLNLNGSWCYNESEVDNILISNEVKIKNES